MRHATWTEVQIHDGLAFLTWLLKLFIEYPPCLCDPFQALFHGLDVQIGTVAFWELGVTIAPAVIVPAYKFTLAVTGYVAESSLHKTFSQVVREDHLQAWETKVYNCQICEVTFSWQYNAAWTNLLNTIS